MHVGGFTRHPSSGVAPGRRGTYAGLIDTIPYLRDLGVSTVELLLVFAFDEQDGPPPGLGNYWGYQPLSFFAPHDAYSSRSDPLGAVDEFRDMSRGCTAPGSRSSSISSTTIPQKGTDAGREARGHAPLLSGNDALRVNRHLPIEQLDMTLNELLRHQPIQWHGVKLNSPDWGHESHTLAATVRLLGYPP